VNNIFSLFTIRSLLIHTVVFACERLRQSTRDAPQSYHAVPLNLTTDHNSTTRLISRLPTCPIFLYSACPIFLY